MWKPSNRTISIASAFAALIAAIFSYFQYRTSTDFLSVQMYYSIVRDFDSLNNDLNSDDFRKCFMIESVSKNWVGEYSCKSVSHQITFNRFLTFVSTTLRLSERGYLLDQDQESMLAASCDFLVSPPAIDFIEKMRSRNYLSERLIEYAKSCLSTKNSEIIQ